MAGDSLLTRTRATKSLTAVVMVVLASGCWTQYRGNLAHSGNQALEFAINTANVSTLTESWTGATVGAVTTKRFDWCNAVPKTRCLHLSDLGTPCVAASGGDVSEEWQ